MRHDKLLTDLREYCARSGFALSTVCVRALGDSRFVARHQRRLEQIERDEIRLRAYMAANPPSDCTKKGAA